MRRKGHRQQIVAAAALALAGCAISLYLAAYQYGLLVDVWEPFFGNGSQVVLNSGLLDGLSRALGVPVHDAAVGAVAYLFEAGLAWAVRRPRTSFVTWVEVAYCGVVVLMGGTGLVLVILQAAMFHSWCTLCLASATISEAILILSRDEIARSVQYLLQHFGLRDP